MMTEREQRLAEIAHIAFALEKQTGCPARLIIAQWAIESNWGAKPCCRSNYFGIKKASRHAESCVIATREVIGGKSVICNLEFADYNSLEDSCRDYAWLITSGEPYRAAWQRYRADRDLAALIAGVARVYATDPDYARIVSAIANQQDIAEALSHASGIPR
jgi:flagellar protein FlgJ